VGWVTVRVWPLAAQRDAALDVFFALGSAGVQDEGESLVTHLADPVDLPAVRAAFADAIGAIRIETGPLDDRSWPTHWHGAVVAHTVGRVTVAPPWGVTGDPTPPGGTDGCVTVVIEPAMAFGTGEHETTRGVLRLMQGILRRGDRVADLGAGSAVLAIAAVLLGAAWAVAIEMDIDAIGNAEANVARNGVGDRVAVLHGDAAMLLPLVAPVRVVLANIISSVLVELLPAIRAALTDDGAVVMSGILVAERDGMLAVLDASGWRMIAEHADGEWWSVAVRLAA